MTVEETAASGLDRWLPNPGVRTYHRCDAASDLDALWTAAGGVGIGESGLLGRLVCWRVPGTRPEQTYHERFTSQPFIVLEQGDHHLLAGLCGKIWTLRPALARLTDPCEFRRWREPGTVRVLFAHWATATPRGAALISEVRVAPVDRAASLGLLGLRPLISHRQDLIGSLPLQIAARRAERGWARGAA